MRIVLVRHGESEGNVDDEAYARLGDPNVPLTPRGWMQADKAGEFLKKFYDENPSPSGKTGQWPLIKVSSFVRPKQTLSGIFNSIIAHGGLKGKPLIHNEIDLIELGYGLMPNLKTGDERIDPQLRQKFADMSKLAHENAPVQSAPPFGEAPMDQYNRVKRFAANLKAGADAGEYDDVLIVSHGHTMRNFLMSWFELPMDAWEELRKRKVDNCDVMVIEQNEKGEWTVETIFDGGTGQPTSYKPLEGIRRKEIDPADLPEVPAFLKRKL